MTRATHRWIRHLLGSGCLIVAMLGLASGCGVSKGKVSGVVSFNGKPLPGGIITFRPTDTRQNPATATIDAEGRYSLTVASGDAMISVDNRGLKATAEAAAPVGSQEHEGKASANLGTKGKGTKGGPMGPGKGGPPMGGGKGPPAGAQVAPPKGALQDMMKEKSRPPVDFEKMPGTYVAIPDRYYNSDTANLKFTVTAGDQTHNVELSPK